MNKKLHNSIRRRGETKNWIKVGGWPKKQQVKGSYKKGRQGARLQQMNFHIRRADVRHARDPLCREQLLLLARWIRFSQVTSIPGNFFNFLLETLIWRKLNEMKLSASWSLEKNGEIDWQVAKVNPAGHQLTRLATLKVREIFKEFPRCTTMFFAPQRRVIRKKQIWIFSRWSFVVLDRFHTNDSSGSVHRLRRFWWVHFHL